MYSAPGYFYPNSKEDTPISVDKDIISIKKKQPQRFIEKFETRGTSNQLIR